MKLTIAKKSCKCNLCGKQINIGDKAQWIEVQKQGHGEWSGKAYNRTLWKLQCIEGCGERLLDKENEEKKAKALSDAQFTLDQMRLIDGISQENIDKLIVYFAEKGIIVK